MGDSPHAQIVGSWPIRLVQDSYSGSGLEETANRPFPSIDDGLIRRHTEVRGEWVVFLWLKLGQLNTD